MNRSLILWASVALSGCAITQVRIPPPSGDTITIFVHGYRGSFLLDPDTKQYAWVSPGDITGLSRKSLARSFEGMEELSRFERLAVGQPVTRLSLLRGLIKEEVYAEFMQWGVGQLPGFVTFAYDWRRDIRESARELCVMKDALVAAHGPDTKVRIIAHSMGGLVTMHCLLNGPTSTAERWSGARNVERVAFFGTPFGGAPGIYDDLIVGTPVGLNKTLLSPEALFTFEAAWQLLPPTPDFFTDRDGRKVSLPAFEQNFWLQQKLGVFREATRRESAAYLAQHQRLVSANAGHWATLEDLSGLPAHLRFLAVVGGGVQTSSGWKLDDGATFTLRNPLTEDGDGTVLTARAFPAATLRSTRVDTRANHVDMMRDPAVLEAVRSFLEAP